MTTKTTATLHHSDLQLALDEHVLRVLPDQPAARVEHLREARAGQVVVAIRPAMLTEAMTVREAAQVLDGNPRLYLVTGTHEQRVHARPILRDDSEQAGLSVGDFTISADPEGPSRHVLLGTGLSFEQLIAEVAIERHGHEQERLAG